MKNNWEIAAALGMMIVTAILFSPAALSQSNGSTMHSPSVTIADDNQPNESTSMSHRSPKSTSASPALPNYGKNLAEMFLYLGLVVALIFLLAWFVKKMGSNHFSSTQLMKVTACLPLSTKEKLMVVQIGEEQVVIGVAPGFVGHITSLKNPLVPVDLSANEKTKNSASNSEAFSNLLARFQKGEAK